MQYAGIIKNDTAAAPGLCLSFFTQGCPKHCPGCHNPETWDFKGGKEFTTQVLDTIVEGLTANGITRSLCIMGGEPLCDDNVFLTRMVIDQVRQKLPDIKIYLWTGYYLDELVTRGNTHLKAILDAIDVLVDGPYQQELRDITLQMRGSTNQHIIDMNAYRESKVDN